MRRSKWLFLLVFGLGGLAVLLTLGTWQWRRAQWKEGLIAELTTRLQAPPAPLATVVPAHTTAHDPADVRYYRVTLEGRVIGPEIHVLATRRPHGPGYRVIAPVETEGRRVLVDFGFVPERHKHDPNRDLNSRLPLTGVIEFPRETGPLTPPPDLAKNIWFAREVPLLAQHAGTEPLLITRTDNDTRWPMPFDPRVDLPNNHRAYMLTWYGLALVWAVMSVILWRRRT